MSEQNPQEWVSKTRMKKQMNDLQDLGVQLTRLSADTLKKIGLPEDLLEAVLAAAGITSRRLESSSRGAFSLRQIVLLALTCALADTTATYVSLQGMSVLYRLYYADWYIYTVMAVNGFCYTAIGAACGAFLGKRLADVGSD